MGKLKLKEALVVEGRYDKNTLSQLVDAPIFVTNGFGIFKDPETLALLRTVAEKRGLIVLTDSDGGGLVIRNHLKGAIDPALVKHAYIPDLFGKEKRKAAPGKEGKLGVEGMDETTILRALQNAGAMAAPGGAAREPITKYDLYACGLSGGAGSREARKKTPARAGSAGAHERQRPFAGLERAVRPGGVPGALFQFWRLK